MTITALLTRDEGERRVFEDKITFRHQSVKDFLLERLTLPQDSLTSRPSEHGSDSSAVVQTSMKQAE